MKCFPLKLVSCGLLLEVLLSGFLNPSPISAQEAPPPDTPTSNSAIDLVIPVRASAGYNTGGSGYEEAVNLEGFIPLHQSPGERITFLEPRLYLGEESNLGGSLLLGHRFYDADDNRIWGGYLAYDNRQTRRNTFHQLGLGVESLGAIWDFHFNAYLPIGDRRQVDREQEISSILNTSTRFQGNFLLLENLIEEQRLRTYEAAAGGFDLEAGARLAHWQGGDLRGYGGIYFYDPAGGDSALGWRLRLDADVNPSLNLGLALQDDDLFGTHLLFSATLTFPRIRPRGPIGNPMLVQARLGEPILRARGIALDRQQEVERSTQQVTMPLMNPEEEQPYRFHHVILGRGAGGDGTFERPFGTVQAALNATRSDGNDVVYVDAGRRVDIPAFTIPDRVQVLSQGPAQLLGGLPFPGFPRTDVRLPFSPVLNYRDGVLVRLPLSGDGNFPVIRGGGADLVRLGNRTVLAGFRLEEAAGNAIVGTSIRDVELRDNSIRNAGDRGIFLDNVTGSVVIFDHQLRNIAGGAGSGQGMLIRNTTDGTTQVTIVRYRASGQRVGIEMVVEGDRPASLTPEQTISLQNVVITDSRDQGLLVQANDVGNQQIDLRWGRILNSGNQGVLIQADNTGSQEVTLENVVIQGSSGAGVQVVGSVLDSLTTSAQEVYLRRNRIENNGGAGIDITANGLAAQEFGIGNNIIRNNGGPGIQAVANNRSFQEFVTDPDNNSRGISDNEISGNSQAGISLTVNSAATAIADIQDNRIADNLTAGNPDLTVTSTSNAADVCAVVNNNTSAAGIRLSNPAGGLFEVGDLPTVATRNTGTVEVLPGPPVFTNKPGAQSCFR
ncbi:right-handed parallel beta-helix repeat-containing protein [Thermoleptolyngbya sp. C42_A2020_037]|uniref:right-handed parallel beta-helix repeat-containing protein n=1 Tax=Thermoleptolyngbya sp. C42_A2020_037 TaxID=2747799 RepID=UPI001A064AFD|nr:right-handed parallel beta-helix repeat-containing protein [Thermoleptolyngbya sp. C42_A2020_037]MBF2084226.1 right-handed parallel beta-helix repeat-containing protein [Thermoleptolyngbya sp. C42_A2020_037]